MDVKEIARGLSEDERSSVAFIARCYAEDDLGKLPTSCPHRLFDIGLVEAYPVSARDERTVLAKFLFTELGHRVAAILKE